jgi:hypothetical protein
MEKRRRDERRRDERRRDERRRDERKRHMGVCNRVQRPRWYKLCYYLAVEPQFPSTCFWCNGKELVEHVA